MFDLDIVLKLAGDLYNKKRISFNKQSMRDFVSIKVCPDCGEEVKDTVKSCQKCNKLFVPPSFHHGFTMKESDICSNNYLIPVLDTYRVARLSLAKDRDTDMHDPCTFDIFDKDGKFIKYVYWIADHYENANINEYLEKEK